MRDRERERERVEVERQKKERKEKGNAMKERNHPSYAGSVESVRANQRKWMFHRERRGNAV